ncbi:MAG: hypothetical protein AABY61_05935 [Nitrospirota bacterium]
MTRLFAPFQSGITSIACAVAFTGLLPGVLTVTPIAATLFGGIRVICPSYGDYGLRKGCAGNKWGKALLILPQHANRLKVLWSGNGGELNLKRFGWYQNRYLNGFG